MEATDDGGSNGDLGVGGDVGVVDDGVVVGVHNVSTSIGNEGSKDGGGVRGISGEVTEVHGHVAEGCTGVCRSIDNATAGTIVVCLESSDEVSAIHEATKPRVSREEKQGTQTAERRKREEREGRAKRKHT